MTRKLVSLLPLALLAACGQEDATAPQLGFHDDVNSVAEAPLTVDHEALLSFNADSNVILGNPPLYAGGRLRVEYDPARLPQCRGRTGGQTGWTITLRHRALPDATARSLALTWYGTRLAGTIAVPEAATHVELWFENTDDQGCRALDDRNGSSYRYATSMPLASTAVRFNGNWTQVPDGPIVQGGLMKIVYDPSRLRVCRATYNGGRTWNIVASWRFLPSNDVQNVSLYDGDYYAGEAAIRQPQVPVPADATQVQFWFSNTDRAGCSAWDSNFGNNYVFDIVAPQAASPAVGWAGDFDFVIAWGNGDTRHGDRDPAYYWNSMEGAPSSSRVEVQVWIPGITDQVYANDEAVRTAAQSRVKAEVLTDALAGAAWGAQDLRFVRKQGNNFLYAFDFWRMRYQIYHNPPIADGLYHYFFRFSTDSGVTWYEAGKQGDRTRRFVVAQQQDCTLFPDNAPSGCPQQRTVGWTGNWGGRFNHACDQVNGLVNPVVFTKSSLGHNCMVVNAEVWVEGLTNVNGDPRAILAQVETDIGFSGGPLAQVTTYDLSYDTRVGNNYRFAWNLNEHVGRADRGDYRFRFRFSANNGATWTTMGTDNSDNFRTLLVRNDSQDVDQVSYCDDIERWEGAFQHRPDCMTYPHPLPALNFPATNCEFYINALGDGSWSHNQSHAYWLEAYVSVGPQQGEVLNVGMLTRYRVVGEQTVRMLHSLGRAIQPNYYLTGFTSHQNDLFNYDVVDFAFYMDVQRPDGGSVVRLWQSNGGANYTRLSGFPEGGQFPPYVQNIGSGSIAYANEGAPFFDQKHACGH
jgi:hypothetical protein